MINCSFVFHFFSLLSIWFCSSSFIIVISIVCLHYVFLWWHKAIVLYQYIHCLINTMWRVTALAILHLAVNSIVFVSIVILYHWYLSRIQNRSKIFLCICDCLALYTPSVVVFQVFLHTKEKSFFLICMETWSNPSCIFHADSIWKSFYRGIIIINFF